MRARGLLLAGAVAFSCGGAAPQPSTTPAATLTGASSTAGATVAVTASPKALWRPTSPPAQNLLLGAADPLSGLPDGSRWIAVDAFDGQALLAAVLPAPTSAAAPVVIYLHGDEGLLERDLAFAASLAKSGFVAVVPCWQGLLSRSPRALACSQAAPRRAAGADVMKDVSAVADAARTLPGARPGRVAVMGSSGGGTAALLAGSMGGRVDAVVAISAGYGGAGSPLAQRWGTTAPEQLGGLAVPVLLVHGTDDVQQPGTRIDVVRGYEKAARTAGKAIDTIYIDGGGHQPQFGDLWTEVIQKKVIDFLAR